MIYAMIAPMGFLGSLFNLIAVYYLFRGAQLVWRFWQERQTLLQPPLSPKGKAYADQGSFYVSVPPGVLIHELGHALAVWAFGGVVLEFRVFGYWGYVLPDRVFPPAQEWFVALSGTLGTLLYAIAVWVIFTRGARPVLRYFGLRSARFNLYFGLLYYPIMTFVLGIGDWRTIYDFAATPVLSGATAAVHVVLLGGLLWLDRRQGVFEMPAFQNAVQANALETLAARADAAPDDYALQIEYARLLLQSGLEKRAEKVLSAVVAREPGRAEAHFWRGVAHTQRGDERGAARHYEQSLAAGLAEGTQRAFAEGRLGALALDWGDYAGALQRFDAALADGETLNPVERARITADRSRTYRQMGNFAMAEADLQRARALAEKSGRQDLLQRITQDEQALAAHRQR